MSQSVRYCIEFEHTLSDSYAFNGSHVINNDANGSNCTDCDIGTYRWFIWAWSAVWTDARSYTSSKYNQHDASYSYTKVASVLRTFQYSINSFVLFCIFYNNFSFDFNFCFFINLFQTINSHFFYNARSISYMN